MKQSRMQWALMLATVLVAMVVSAATEQVQPRADEFRDGPFFVSWRYATRSGSVVSPTPKVSSRRPPTFGVGDGFEFNITLRVPPGEENPCAVRRCTLEAEITVTDPSGQTGTLTKWERPDVLSTGLQTFSFEGETTYYHAEYKYYLDYRIRISGDSLVKQNHFPFRVVSR